MSPNYSFKEKKKWLLALMNPDAAALDLALLSEADPRNTQLTAFGLNPARYAEDILFSLLDLKTAEEIRLNRRKCLAPAKQLLADTGAAVIDTHSDSEKGNATNDGSVPDGKPEGVEEPGNGSDLKEAQQRAEEAEQRAEEAKKTLADSKKKAASKKKKSTRA